MRWICCTLAPRQSMQALVHLHLGPVMLRACLIACNSTSRTCNPAGRCCPAAAVLRQSGEQTHVRRVKISSPSLHVALATGQALNSQMYAADWLQRRGVHAPERVVRQVGVQVSVGVHGHGQQHALQH